jgi:hypothetical protein
MAVRLPRTRGFSVTSPSWSLRDWLVQRPGLIITRISARPDLRPSVWSSRKEISAGRRARRDPTRDDTNNNIVAYCALASPGARPFARLLGVLYGDERAGRRAADRRNPTDGGTHPRRGGWW